MKRHTITLGASTTAGGKVIMATANGSINGVKIALESDLIFCPACKSQGTIVCVGPRIPESWNGKQVALENDLCLCGCPVPPKLNANQSLRCQVIGEETSSSFNESTAQSAPAVRDSTPSDDGEIIEQFFSLLDEDDHPVEGFRYDLYKDGAIYTKASSFLNGETVRVTEQGNLRLVAWFNVDGATRHG